jgi:hypothetical protein
MTDSSTTGPAGGTGHQADGAGQLARFRARGFFPADFAVVESGKVYASGAYWSMLQFPAFPAVLPTMALVAIIEIPFHANHADHSFVISLIDLDEKPFGVRIEGVFRAAPALEHKYGQPGVSPVAVPIQGLVLERAGEYSFTLAVDGTEIARYGFSVVQTAVIAMMQGLPAPPTAPDAPGE